MRRKFLIGLATYLAFGVVFGLVTDREIYMCPGMGPRDGEHLSGVPLRDNVVTVAEVPRNCFPIISKADRLQWVATTAPGWLPLVIRNAVRGESIQIGNVILGPIPS